MIQHTQYGIAQDISFETADAGVQGFAYSQDAPLARASAIEPVTVQSVHATPILQATGLHPTGIDAGVILLLLLVMVYGLARWLRRRSLARASDDFQFDSKLDPATIRVFGLHGKS